jgi:hypothetical protein
MLENADVQVERLYWAYPIKVTVLYISPPHGNYWCIDEGQYQIEVMDHWVIDHPYICCPYCEMTEPPCFHR